MAPLSLFASGLEKKWGKREKGEGKEEVPFFMGYL